MNDKCMSGQIHKKHSGRETSLFFPLFIPYTSISVPVEMEKQEEHSNVYLGESLQAFWDIQSVSGNIFCYPETNWPSAQFVVTSINSKHSSLKPIEYN